MSKTNSWALKLVENSLDGIDASNYVLKQFKLARYQWTDPSYSKRSATNSLAAATSSILALLA